MNDDIGLQIVVAAVLVLVLIGIDALFGIVGIVIERKQKSKKE